MSLTNSRAPKYPIRSVTNALRILDLLSRGRSMRATDLADRLEISRSTTSRVLATLQRHGFVVHDPDTHVYALGPALVTIGLAVVERMPLRLVARASLETLAVVTGETAELVLLDGSEIVVVDLVEGTNPVHVVDPLGLRVPAHLSAGGKAILASCSRADVDQRVPARALRTRTGTSIASKSALLRELDQVARQGYAFNNQELDEQLAVAAAVTAPDGRPVGAVVSVFPPNKSHDAIVELTQLVQEAAGAVTTELGHSSARRPRVVDVAVPTGGLCAPAGASSNYVDHRGV